MPALTDDDPGELMQKLGEEGARRAKLWLDATTRVTSTWSVYDKFGVSRLKYPWREGGRSYSYDLGGIFFGGDLHQGGHFDKFLAQSYVTLKTYPYLADHFLWITWHPFRLGKWNELSSEENIRVAIVKERARVFGEEVTEEQAANSIEQEIVADLVDRVWVIVLSDKQETLVVSREDRSEIMKLRTLQEEQ